MQALFLPAALALVVAAVPNASRSDALEDLERRQQQLFLRVAPSVVLISTRTGIGTGFFVSEDGLILSNAHVVGEEKAVSVLLQDGRKLDGKVEALAPDGIDLALVRVPIANSKPLPIGGSSLQVGSWVASVGHGLGGAWTFTTGMVSNIYPLGTERPVFQTQIPLNPGNSGGPIVDRNGKVVGIATAGVSRSNDVNFALRADIALRVFPSLTTDCDCLVIQAPAGVSVFVDGVLAGKGPRVVVPVSASRTYRVQAASKEAIREIDVRWPEQRTLTIE